MFSASVERWEGVGEGGWDLEGVEGGGPGGTPGAEGDRQRYQGTIQYNTHLFMKILNKKTEEWKQ